MSNAEQQAKRIIARAKKAKASKRKWNWGDQEKPGGRVYECEYLGDTVIQYAGDWETQRKDCAFVAEACQSAPAVALAYLDLLERCKAAGMEVP
jgi:hypothetical protein